MIAWNGFPKRISKAIINKTLRSQKEKHQHQDKTGDNRDDILVSIPYASTKSDVLLQLLQRTFKRYLSKKY